MLVAYRFGVVGGGDLKLMTAVSLWAGLDALPQLLLWTALAGGAFALGLIVLRRLLGGLLVVQPFAETVTLPRLLLPGEAIPYGVAIAIGGILVARNLPHLRSEEHTSELQSLMRISYAVFCLKKKINTKTTTITKYKTKSN